MKPLILALSFLTRLPMPRVEADESDFAAAIRLYPVAGLVIGAIVAGALRLGAIVDPWAGALAALIAWVWVTGALHLDGLADLSDGLGAAHGDRSRLLAVMADPHIGSFGVVTLVMQLLAKLVLLHALPLAAWPIVALIPAAARVGPLIWARVLPPLRPPARGESVAAGSGIVVFAGLRQFCRSQPGRQGHGASGGRADEVIGRGHLSSSLRPRRRAAAAGAT